jgi:hypothetical protein
MREIRRAYLRYRSLVELRGLVKPRRIVNRLECTVATVKRFDPPMPIFTRVDTLYGHS